MIKDLSPTKWFTEIQKGLDYRRKYALEDSWARLEAMLYNVHPTQANAGPNVMISTLEALASSMIVPSPYIMAKPRTSGAIEKASLLESAMNLIRSTVGLSAELERMVTSSFCTGVGVGKVGYDSEFGWDDTLDIGMMDGQRLGMTTSQHDRKGHLLEYNDVQPGMPWFQAVMSQDFVVPWGVFSLKRSPWCAQRIVRHIDAVREDLKYDKNVAKDTQPNMTMEDFVKSYHSVAKPYRVGAEYISLDTPEGMEYVEMWEIHDRQTGRVKVMATGGTEWLRDDPDGLQVGGLPYVALSFAPKLRNFWTTPDAFYLMYHQAELSDIAVQITRHRKIQLLKFLYDKGALDQQEINNLLKGDVGVAVGIKAGQSLEEVIKILNVPTPNLSLYQDAEQVRRNAREMVGFSQNQVGEYQGGRKTAAEVAEVAQSSGLRLDRRQGKVRDVIIDIFHLINPIIFENWTTPRVLEIVGQDGLSKWFPVTGQDLRGDYLYDITFSTGGQQTLGERKAMALQIFQMFSQDPRFDPIKLAQWVSRAVNDPEFTAAFAQGVINGTAGGGAGGGSSPQGQAPAQVPQAAGAGAPGGGSLGAGSALGG